MNVIFLTTSRINNINTPGIYTDLMRKFRDEGHQVYIVVPVERKFGQKTQLKECDGVKILDVRTLNIQKTNIIEKGIGTILLERQFIKAIKKHFGNIHFDLILYSTPPITFNGVVSFLKKKNPKAVSYLLLKDIFPQNAVDLEMFSHKSMFYRYFRNKEIQLYKISDFIGCMSPANVEFVLKHNEFVNPSKVEVAPNCIELSLFQQIDVNEVKRKYDLPENIPILVYGGNLGKPQGMDFIIKVLQSNKDRKDCFFLIVGSGTEFHKLDNWINHNNPANVKLMSQIPKHEFNALIKCCDVGLIFLDHRFTIPNYPSRLLSYLENRLPVLAATDINSDIGKIAEANSYGLWCESRDVEDFNIILDKLLHSDLKAMGERGYKFLQDNYMVADLYRLIISHVN